MRSERELEEHVRLEQPQNCLKTNQLLEAL